MLVGMVCSTSLMITLMEISSSSSYRSEMYILFFLDDTSDSFLGQNSHDVMKMPLFSLFNVFLHTYHQQSLKSTEGSVDQRTDGRMVVAWLRSARCRFISLLPMRSACLSSKMSSHKTMLLLMRTG